MGKYVLVAAIDLHEDRPLPVVGLGGFPSLDDLDLVRVIDEDMHGSANGCELISEGREVCNFVGRHREAVKNLLRSEGMV